VALSGYRKSLEVAKTGKVPTCPATATSRIAEDEVFRLKLAVRNWFRLME
jgi:hypothetical protein